MADCTGTVGPKFPDNGENGNEPNESCTPTPDGTGYCPTTNQDPTCKPWQLTDQPDSCFVDGLVNEALGIAGADLNVFKLLGVHEQGQLVDCTGQGQAISNGDAPGFPASNAFNVYVSEWRSIQKGTDVRPSAYIGYDFGEIKTNDDSRRMYGVDTSIFKHITAFAIKQSADPTKRVLRARLERSPDGIKWYGVKVVNLPDDDCLNTVLVGDSVPSRYWRLRPVAFEGGSSDYWGVQAMQMFHNYLATNDDNIQDKIFLENRDRDYADESLLLKGSYDIIDVQTELSRFGIELPAQTMYMNVSFSACVAVLGRPLVIGDIIELPSEIQYSATMRPIKKWMEVTDTSWSTEGYTPGWQPTLLRVVLQPAYASQETQDIFGDLAEYEIPDELGLVDKGDGHNPNYQDYSDVSQTAEALAKEAVPQRGRETSGTIRKFEDEEVELARQQGVPNLNKFGQNPTGLYTEDAMPPNNAPFTEGPTYPTGPAHGDYHRLTYEGLSKDVPASLYRYSSSKGRWIFLEQDRRDQYDPAKPRLHEFLKSPNRRDPEHILRDEDEC